MIVGCVCPLSHSARRGKRFSRSSMLLPARSQLHGCAIEQLAEFQFGHDFPLFFPASQNEIAMNDEPGRGTWPDRAAVGHMIRCQTITARFCPKAHAVIDADQPRTLRMSRILPLTVEYALGHLGDDKTGEGGSEARDQARGYEAVGRQHVGRCRRAQQGAPPTPGPGQASNNAIAARNGRRCSTVMISDRRYSRAAATISEVDMDVIDRS